jgi:hypothetical protein
MHKLVRVACGAQVAIVCDRSVSQAAMLCIDGDASARTDSNVGSVDMGGGRGS